MDIWRSLGGMRQVKITTADPQGVMSALTAAGIVITDPEMTDPLTWQFKTSRFSCRKVMDITKRRGENCVMEEKTGLYWTLLCLRRRPVLVIGFLLLLVLSLWVPSRVLFVEVVGNQQISARMVMENAADCGVRFGASRNRVRSQLVKDRLLSSLPQLQWAGVTTRGCVAVITVRERSQPETKEDGADVCSIVAARDGVLTEMTVLRGNALCSPGQSVKAGQVLISAYADYGICIRAVRAEGEIFARTKREFKAIFPQTWDGREEILGSEKKFSLIIGKKQINFYKGSGISGTSCAKIYEQKYMTLPGGFRLPVSLLIQEWIYYDPATVDSEDCRSYLTSFAEEYIAGQMIAGKIEQAQTLFTQINGCTRLDGVYNCLESIGQVRMEESIPDYGKSN